MKIICLLLCILPLTTAKVFPRTEVNDVFDGVEGIMYDVPEYEDPEVSLFKMISRGMVPVYTMRNADADSKALSNKDDKPLYQIDDIKKGLDTIIIQLQEAKKKLESGNNAIYLDIDKSVLSLESLKQHLYSDLHPSITSKIKSALSDIITKGSTDKGSGKKYAVVKASFKKFLPSDYSTYTLDIPTIKPLSPSIIADNSDADLVPYALPIESSEESSTDDCSDEQSFDIISSKDLIVPSGIEKPLSVGATTAQAIVLDKSMFKYDLITTDEPPVEADEKGMKIDMVEDVFPFDAEKKVEIDMVEDVSPVDAEKKVKKDKVEDVSPVDAEKKVKIDMVQDVSSAKAEKGGGLLVSIYGFLR